MSEAEMLAACRDIRLLTTFWAGLACVFFIAAVYFGCSYVFGVRVRLQRMRRSLERVAKERSDLRVELAIAKVKPAGESTPRLEGMVAQLEGEVRRLDAIRNKTEAACVTAKRDLDQALVELRDEKDLRLALEGLLQAMNVEHIDVVV